MFKIVIVTNALGGGGAERAMNLLANELTVRGIEVALIPINDGVPDVTRLRCTVHPMGRKIDAGVLETIKVLARFRKKIEDLAPEFVILNCDLPELFGLFLPKWASLIIVEHANPAWSTRQQYGKLVRVFHILKKSTFVAVSDHLRIWPTSRFPKAVTKNIIVRDQASIKRMPSEEKITRLVFVGRLAKFQKRPNWLIDISRKVNIPVLFIGAGEESNNLKLEAKVQGVSAEFCGYQINPWEFISLGDLVVIPSLFEGDGLVAIEAISNGIPILLADIRDFRRFGLDDKFYASSIEDFTDKIISGKDFISSFIVSEHHQSQILQGRHPTQVGDLWLDIFQNLRRNVE